MGHEVVGIDADTLPYGIPGLTFHQGDFLELSLDEARFDIVVLCSVVEHIGLRGRYQQKDVPDGDLQAMRKVARLLKSGGILILTIPVGADLVFKPWHRIYGRERLPHLLDGFFVLCNRFFVKLPGDLWRQTDEHEAVRFDGKGLSYALGQYVLR